MKEGEKTDTDSGTGAGVTSPLVAITSARREEEHEHCSSGHASERHVDPQRFLPE